MNENVNVNVNANANPNQNGRKRLTAQELMSGEFLIRDWVKNQYLLLIEIGVLMFLYIFFGFQAQRQQHQLTNLQKEWQAKHFEQLTIEAELTERTRQSTMARELGAMNSELKTNQKPVIHLP